MQLGFSRSWPLKHFDAHTHGFYLGLFPTLVTSHQETAIISIRLQGVNLRASAVGMAIRSKQAEIQSLPNKKSMIIIYYSNKIIYINLNTM